MIRRQPMGLPALWRVRNLIAAVVVRSTPLDRGRISHNSKLGYVLQLTLFNIKARQGSVVVVSAPDDGPAAGAASTDGSDSTLPAGELVDRWRVATKPFRRRYLRMDILLLPTLFVNAPVRSGLSALCKQGGKGSRICLFKDRQSCHPEESATGCSLVVNVKLFLCAVSHISDAVQIITNIGLCP